MLTSVLILSASGLVFGLLLSFASKKYNVIIDEKEVKIREALPAINCGACGFVGCNDFAKALAKNNAPTNGCLVGGSSVIEDISEILGIKAEISEREVAVVMCKGGSFEAENKYKYMGIMDCKSASLVSGGPKFCNSGCVGLGSCEAVCQFDAISMGDNGLPIIDNNKCTSCAVCVKNCPKNIIMMIPESNNVHIYCSSHEKGNLVRKYCNVGCIACRKCVKICPENAIDIENFLACINPSKCTNCGECISNCPTNTIERLLFS